MIELFNTLASTISIAIPAFIVTLLLVFLNYTIIKLFVRLVNNIIFRISGKLLIKDNTIENFGCLVISSVAVSIEAMIILIFIL